MPRAFDHAVLAARDLDALRVVFERLGFLVGARNRHPWGTVNHVVQFADTFIELISIGPGFVAPVDLDPHIFSFAGFVRDYLAERQGFALLGLHTDNARFDHDAFKYEQIGDFEPFHFERHSRTPGGHDIPIGFTLAFVRSADLPHAGFFTCQHHHPERFWNKDFQVHANTATGVTDVVIAAERPDAHKDFLANYTDQRKVAESAGTQTFELRKEQRLHVMTPRAIGERYGNDGWPDGMLDGSLAALEIAVADVAQLEAVLARSGLPHHAHGGRIVVDPAVAMGVCLAFQPED